MQLLCSCLNNLSKNVEAVWGLLSLHTQELEPCIGCMQVPANTKLVKLCHVDGKRQYAHACVCMCVLTWLWLAVCVTGADNESDCQQCFCRPMWCLSCLGRWFASRQDQERPETWLSSRVPCPTCRAKFCVLDICLVRWQDSHTDPRTVFFVWCFDTISSSTVLEECWTRLRWTPLCIYWLCALSKESSCRVLIMVNFGLNLSVV